MAVTVEGAAAVAQRPAGFVRRSTDTSPVNNSTTLVDTGLALAVEANATYEIKAFIAYNATTTADMKCSLVLPAGASGVVTPNALRAAATGVSDTIQRQVISNLNNIVLGGTGGNAVALIEGTITMDATAGQVKIQFAQSTAEASDCTVNTGSYLKLIRVA